MKWTRKRCHFQHKLNVKCISLNPRYRSWFWDQADHRGSKPQLQGRSRESTESLHSWDLHTVIFVLCNSAVKKAERPDFKVLECWVTLIKVSTGSHAGGAWGFFNSALSTNPNRKRASERNWFKNMTKSQFNINIINIIWTKLEAGQVAWLGSRYSQGCGKVRGNLGPICLNNTAVPGWLTKV